MKSCDSHLAALLPSTKSLTNVTVSLALLVLQQKPCDLQVEKYTRSWNPPVLSTDRLSVQKIRS